MDSAHFSNFSPPFSCSLSPVTLAISHFHEIRQLIWVSRTLWFHFMHLEHPPEHIRGYWASSLLHWLSLYGLLHVCLWWCFLSTSCIRPTSSGLYLGHCYVLREHLLSKGVNEINQSDLRNSSVIKGRNHERTWKCFANNCGIRIPTLWFPHLALWSRILFENDYKICAIIWSMVKQQDIFLFYINGRTPPSQLLPHSPQPLLFRKPFSQRPMEESYTPSGVFYSLCSVKGQAHTMYKSTQGSPSSHCSCLFAQHTEH